MYEQVCKLIFQLYLYADNTKMIHYSTNGNHIHELCDTVRDDILSFVDDLAEQYFGIEGKPKYNDFSLKQEITATDDIGMLCKNASGTVDWLRKKCEPDTKFSGIVSLIDDFKGKMAKDAFLSTFDKLSNRNED